VLKRQKSAETSKIKLLKRQKYAILTIKTFFIKKIIET